MPGKFKQLVSFDLSRTDAKLVILKTPRPLQDESSAARRNVVLGKKIATVKENSPPDKFITEFISVVNPMRFFPAVTAGDHVEEKAE